MPRMRSRRSGRRDDRIRVQWRERRAIATATNERFGTVVAETSTDATTRTKSIGRSDSGLATSTPRSSPWVLRLGPVRGFRDRRPRGVSSAWHHTSSSPRALGVGGRSLQFARARRSARYLLQAVGRGRGTTAEEGVAAWDWETRLGAKHRSDVCPRDARRGCWDIRTCGDGRSGVGESVARATGATGDRGGGAGPRVAADAERPVGHF